MVIDYEELLEVTIDDKHNLPYINLILNLKNI